MGRPISICKVCKRVKERVAKGMCNACYKREGSPLILCKRCNKKKPHHAQGYCHSCYSYAVRLDYIKDWNHRKLHGITKDEHDKITKECIICGFKEIVDLHHIDKNRNNRNSTNLVGLCPNHHKMIHMIKYSDEVRQQILERQQVKSFK